MIYKIHLSLGLCFGLFFLAACGKSSQDNFFNKTLPDASSSLRSENQTKEWKNPTLQTDLPRLGGSPDLQEIPEGLQLLDENGVPSSKLDANKDTVIFVHGWSIDGVVDHAFPEVKEWSKKFNTLIYRWHRRSYDPSLFPAGAYNRSFSEGPRFAAEYTRLKEALGGVDYQGEMRIVGFSFGAIVATEAASVVFSDSFRKPRRLEFLDPAFVEYDFRGYDASFGTPESENALRGIALKLFNLRNQNVKIVAYKGAVSTILMRTLSKIINVQELDILSSGQNLIFQHIEMVNYYFRSLSQKPGVLTGTKVMPEPFSARLPTDKFPRFTVRLAQTNGAATSDIQDDTYVRIAKEPCGLKFQDMSLCF